MEASRSDKSIAYIVLIVICILPGTALSYLGIQEPWTEFRVARAELSIQNGQLVDYATEASGFRAEHLGGELTYAALIQATSLPLQWIVLIPIGSLLLGIMFFGLCMELFDSRFAAACVTLFGSLYYPRLVSQFATNMYAWTNILFLAFLIVYRRWTLQRRSIYSILLVVIFFATFLFYHTTPVWIITAVFIGAVGSYLYACWNKGKNPSIQWALPVSFVVGYLFFDTVSYGALARFQNEIVSDLYFKSFLNRIIAPLVAGKSQAPLEPYEIVQTNPRIPTLSTMFVLLILVLPVGIWVLKRILEVLKKRDLRELCRHQDHPYIWSIVAAALAHAIVYSFYGAFSTRVIPLAFPLILPLVLRDFGWQRKSQNATMVLLCIFALIGFVGLILSLDPQSLSSEFGSIVSIIESNSRILADPNIYGSIQLSAAEAGIVQNLTWVDDVIYQQLMGDLPWRENQFDYIAAEISDTPVMSLDWQYYEPFLWNVSAIDMNPNLHKIYQSDALMLYQPQGFQLPSTPADIELLDTVTAGGEFAGNTTRLIIGVVLVAFLPGIIPVALIRKRGLLELRSIYSFIAMGIGLSVCSVTVAGYIANFVFVRVGLIIPLTLCITIIAIALALVSRKKDTRISASGKSAILATGIVILIWAFLASGAAKIRTDNHNNFTEFFITESGGVTDEVKTVVINREDTTAKYEILLQIDTDLFELFGPEDIALNEAWEINLKLPNVSTREKLAVILIKNGEITKSLHLWLPLVWQ